MILAVISGGKWNNGRKMMCRKANADLAAKKNLLLELHVPQHYHTKCDTGLVAYSLDWRHMSQLSVLSKFFLKKLVVRNSGEHFELELSFTVFFLLFPDFIDSVGCAHLIPI